MQSSYHLTLPAPVLAHGWGPVRLLRDGAELSQLELEARVRSGYYFVTLANELERLEADMVKPSRANRVLVSQLLAELDYLQAHYEIKKKPEAD